MKAVRDNSNFEYVEISRPLLEGLAAAGYHYIARADIDNPEKENDSMTDFYYTLVGKDATEADLKPPKVLELINEAMYLTNHVPHVCFLLEVPKDVYLVLNIQEQV